jgi:hypothetical protein
MGLAALPRRQAAITELHAAISDSCRPASTNCSLGEFVMKAIEKCRWFDFSTERYIAEIIQVLRSANPGYIESLWEVLNRKFNQGWSAFLPEKSDPEKDPIVNRIIDVLGRLDVDSVKGIYAVSISALEQIKKEAESRKFVYRRMKN